METRQLMTSRCIGGWEADTQPRLNLFQVTIHTSIEDWEEYVLAHSEEELQKWLAVAHPKPWCKGYEPTIKLLSSGLLDSIYIVTDNPSLLHPEIPEIL